MPRKKRRSPKRSLTMGGIALEVATLLAILMLARPDWIARGFQVVERYQTSQQSWDTTDATLQPEQAAAPIHGEEKSILPPGGIFPPHSATMPFKGQDPQEIVPPAIVIPAGEWLPGYFDIVQHQYQPPAMQPTMPYGHRQYRLSTPMNPWNNPSGRHF